MNKGTLVASAMAIGSLLSVVFMIRLILSPPSIPGDALWALRDGQPAAGPVHVTASGLTLIVGVDNIMRALGPGNQQTMWRFSSPTRQPLLPPSVELGDNLVVISSEEGGGYIYAVFTGNGSAAWNRSAAATTRLSPVAAVRPWAGSRFSTLATLYGAGTNIRSFNLTTRQVQWTYATGGLVVTPPAYCAAITAAVGGSDDGYVYALQMWTGSLLWRAKLSAGTLLTSPVISGSIVYCATSDGYVAALQAADGSVKWERSLLGNIRTAPILAGSDNLLIIGSGLGEISALSTASGKRAWVSTVSSGGAVACMAADLRSVYAVTPSGNTVAFAVETGHRQWEVKGQSFHEETSLALNGEVLVVVGRHVSGIETVVRET
jgi:outer membrane protein assembly factor BamB